MLEKASPPPGTNTHYASDEKFGDILSVIDVRIAKQEETVRSMRAALEAEELALEQLKQAQKSLVGGAGTVSLSVANKQSLPSRRANGRSSRRKMTASEVIFELAKEALSTESIPLTRADIVNVLECSGAAPASRDLPSLVSKVLWKNRDTFQQVGKGYWLKGRPVPESIK